MTACSNGSSNTNETNKKVDNGKNSNSNKKVTITMAQWGTGEEIKQTKSLLNIFEKKYPNINVKLTYKSWDSYWTWLTAQASAESLPDVYKMGSSYARKFANLGVMQNLDKFISSTSFDMSNFTPNILSFYKVDGHFTAIPRDANTVVMFYNKDLFDKAGLDYPEETMSWDQVLKLAQKLTLDRNGNNALSSSFDPKHIKQYGIAVDAAGTADSVLEPQLFSNGARLVGKNHELKLNTPQAMHVLKFFRSLITKYHVSPNSQWIKSNGNDPFKSLATGKVAMSFAGNWYVPQFKKAGLNIGIMLPPKFKKVKTVVQPASYAMSSFSKKKKAAWKLISWLTGPKGQKEMAKNGQAMPANKTAFKYYLKKYKNINKEVFLDAQKKAITAPVFPGKTKLWFNYIPQKLEQPLNGKGSIKKAVKQTENLWNPKAK